jgi:hypothetical protein
MFADRLEFWKTLAAVQGGIFWCESYDLVFDLAPSPRSVAIAGAFLVVSASIYGWLEWRRAQ